MNRNTPPILSTSGLTKRFGSFTALDRMDFDLYRGEVHAIVGENGAGKSTFVKLLSGIYQPSAGSFSIDGKETSFKGPKDSMEIVGLVHQDRELIPNFTGFQNLFLGTESSRMGFLRKREMKRSCIELMKEFQLELEMDTPVERLSPGEQEMITILKILSRRTPIIILDEPTASLSQKESDMLFELIESLRKHGLSIIYISHRLPEVLSLSDRITVLRNGRKVTTFENEGITEEQLIAAMINRDLENQYPIIEREKGDEVLDVEEYTYERERLENISFSVRRGEIVGFAGLVGSGRTELFRSFFTGAGRTGKAVKLEGIPIASHSPGDSIRRGIVMVPEDRRNEGVITSMSVKDNLILPNMDILSRFGFRQERRIEEFSRDIFEKLSIAAESDSQAMRTLSGGNQQKAAIGKWLAKHAKLWIFDEPTQGIDVETKSEIYRLLGTLARDGAGVVFISSDLRELTELCDRIYVMRDRKIVEQFSRPYSREQILSAMIVGVKDR